MIQQALLKKVFTPRLRHILKTLEPYETRLVGGVVRDLILGREHKDIDLATQATPEQVIEKLEGTKIKAFPTGIDHGTLTLFYKGLTVEITTLRRDVHTDGRRARVEFTTDFSEDALRRDFTFNALYLNEKGEVDDPTGGLKDLQNNVVRFIGDADERLKEDHLRLLRYFRFVARMDNPKIDSNLEDTLKKHIPELSKLSAERIWSEVQKIIVAPKCFDIWPEMARIGVLKALNLKEGAPASLQQMHRFKTQKDNPLFALYLVYGEESLHLPLKISKRQKNILKATHTAYQGLKNSYSQAQQCYLFGREPYSEALQVEACKTHNPKQAKALLSQAQSALKEPVRHFPVTGEDLQKLGIKTGPKMGTFLKDLENWWVSNHFPRYKKCLEEAKKRIMESV